MKVHNNNFPSPGRQNPQCNEAKNPSHPTTTITTTHSPPHQQTTKSNSHTNSWLQSCVPRNGRILLLSPWKRLMRNELRVRAELLWRGRVWLVMRRLG